MRLPIFTSSEQRYGFNLDEQARDQFLVREDKFVYLNWLDHLDKSAKSALSTDYMSVNFVVNKIVFSPLGSYLAVCCNQGVHLYYGNELSYKGLLRQVNSVDAKFSADERYLVTFNGSQNKNRENLILWAVEEEVKIKAYRAHANQSLESFQFSEDGNYLAILLQNEVTFFNLGSVEELQKQVKGSEEDQHVIKAVHVQKAAWLRSKGQIIIMCYELDYSPVTMPATRIFLYNVEQKV